MIVLLKQNGAECQSENVTSKAVHSICVAAGSVTEPAASQNGVSEMSMHGIVAQARLSALAALPLPSYRPGRQRGVGQAAPSIRATSTTWPSWAMITVAYFTDGRATKGSEEFAYDWLGATWQFANAEHQRDLSPPPRSGTRRNTAAYAPWAWPLARGRSTSTLKLGASSTASFICSSAKAGWSKTGIRIPRPWWRRLTPTGRRSRPSSPRDDGTVRRVRSRRRHGVTENRLTSYPFRYVYSSCLSGVPVGLR